MRRETWIGCLSYVPPTEDPAMCSDQESNGDLSLCGAMLNQLSHTSQGPRKVFKQRSIMVRCIIQEDGTGGIVGNGLDRERLVEKVERRLIQ